jgi:type I restriction enzyme, S subunit
LQAVRARFLLARGENQKAEAMKRYDSYKDSGIEWIGEIPGHWEVRRFGHLFSFSRGLGITKQDLKDEGIPCVNYGEIHSKYGFKVNPEIHQLKCVEESYLETADKSLLKRGDFVFADTSEDIEGSGNFTVLDSDLPTFAGYHTILARHANENHYKYLAYCFDSLEFRNQIKSAVSGIKVFSITHAILKSTNVLLPPLPEQTAIARYLDRKTAELDELIADKRRLLGLYEEEKTAIINQAVTKGLHPDVPMKDSGIEWLGEVPEEWGVKRLRYLAKMQGGYAFSSSDFTSSGIQLIKISNLYNNELHLERQPTFLSESFLESHSDWIISNGDILMSMTGTLGKRDYGFAILIDGIDGHLLLNQRVSKIHSVNEIEIELLIHCLRSEYFLNSLFCLPAGTKQGNFSNENVLSQKVVFPIDIDEQRLIVHHIETECARIDAKKAKPKS